MKNNKSILGLLLGLAVVGFTACDDDDYTATPMPATDQVFFSTANSKEILLEENQNAVSVILNRIKTENELTVKVTAQDTSNLFTVAQAATFKAGEATASIPVNFDFSQLTPDNPYEITISVSDGCDYAENSVPVIIKYAPWSEWAPLGWSYPAGVKTFGDWEEAYATATTYAQIAKNGVMPIYTFTAYYGGDDKSAVFFRKSMLNASQSQLMVYDVAGTGANFIFDWNQVTGQFYLPKTFFTNNDTYGAVYAGDPVSYRQSMGKNETYDDYPSSFDEENGKFELYIAYYVEAGWFGAGPEYIQLPGYEKADYSVTIVDRGLFVDAKDNLGEVFSFKFGADLGSIKYAIVPDTGLDEEEIAAAAADVLSGNIESVKTTESGDKIIYGEVGDYILIVCQYDNDGNYQDYTAVKFSIVSPKTWSEIATGTYYYTTFFANADGSPALDEGLKLFQCNEEPSLYKIKDWGMGSEFKFSVSDDGAVVVEEAEILEEEGEVFSIADMFGGCAIYDYMYDWSFVLTNAYANYCDGSETTPGYFDEESNAYMFNVVYYSNKSLYTWGFEAFELDGAAAAPVKARAPMIAAMNKAPKSAGHNRAFKKILFPKHNLVIR